MPVVRIDVTPFTAILVISKKKPEITPVVVVVDVADQRPNGNPSTQNGTFVPTPPFHDFIKLRLLSVMVEFYVWLT